MAKTTKLLLLLLFFSFNIVLAQPNSVLLQDGAGTLISSHSSIQEAYNTIPSTLNQPYMIEVTNAYDASSEAFPVTFVNKPGADAINTIRIYSPFTATNFVNIAHNGELSSAFIFDNADWMIVSGNNANNINMLRFNSTSNMLAFPVIQFINGSCNNRFDSCGFSVGLSNTNMIPIIEFGLSSIATGNSDNIIRACSLNNNILSIMCRGTVSNPNKNNTIACNKIHTNGKGIWLREGTGKTTIDSNYINNQTFGIVADMTDIEIENITDSIIITRNRLRNYLYGDPNETMRSIYIKSTSGSNAYTFVANNAICFQSAENQHGLMADENTYVTGIEYDGTYAIKADIYHNTVRIEEQLDSNVIIPGYSACFKRTGSHAANVYNVRNNIFSSERFGQTFKHFAMDLDNTAGALLINNNNYTDISSYCIKYNNTLYSSFSAYQAIIGGGNETNSTDVPAEFQGPFDHHVYGNMVGNSSFYGTAIPGIGTDNEGDARINPYMGCDEYAVNCTGITPNLYFGPGLKCEGDTFLINSDLIFYGNGNIWQWQSRPAGSTGPFIDIPGATHYVLITSATESTEYRLKRSCIDNSVEVFSPTHTVTINPLPSAAGILETHVGMDYNFSADNPQDVTLYTWDFGDGSTPDSTVAPTHTYSDTGAHTVTLILFNNCGSDTLTIIINAQPLAVNNIEISNAIALFPNPASGELHIMKSNLAVEEITVYNPVGAAVLVNNVKNLSRLDISHLAGGNYIVQIKTNKGTVHKKLQVQR